MNMINVFDKKFSLYISQADILKRVDVLATQISNELSGKDIIFLGILNGSFMFTSDLMKRINMPCQITFLKLASYQGTSTSGNVKRLIGLNEDIAGKTVVVIEDIVDTGTTLEQIRKQLIGYEPAEVKYATLLYKPQAYKGNIKLDYVGFEIPDKFVVGYGLDYSGFGRNYPDIYAVSE
ncbi:MAG: hypoxanthine phosphoribosyltransferase [Salinivirgaceae bacterium]|nr:hypoxanthine phosphoribosyltransferase [Bacteroidales bacterium]